jgi:alkylation response protein AidB-like acyl-CoA dehydrogenase
MTFALSSEQVALRDMARDFARARIEPHALEWDEQKHFPVDVLREAASLGMAGIYVREHLGGSGMSRLDATLVFEALADFQLGAFRSDPANKGKVMDRGLWGWS